LFLLFCQTMTNMEGRPGKAGQQCAGQRYDRELPKEVEPAVDE